MTNDVREVNPSGPRKPFPKLFILGSLLVAGSASAGTEAKGLPPQVGIAPCPEWVEAVPLPMEKDTSSGREAISYGVKNLLFDNQIFLGQTNASYYHCAYRFLTEAGVRDSSSIQITYDPSYQSVAFHSLRRLRNGQVIDSLKSESLRVLNRENNLELNLLDGRNTLLALLEDVRVGDVVEYAYTLSGDNPIFEGRYSGSFLFRWTVPLLRHRLRILLPADRTLRQRLYGEGAFEPARRLFADKREWLWEQTNVPPVQLEGNFPLWHKPLPEVALSEYASWAEVARWASANFRATNRVTQALVPQLADWQLLTSEEDRTVAALDFVQNEIRYFGLELGTGSHRPNPPDLVLHRRFGDCKDKAALLCALLAELKIRAEPVLVNALTRGRIEEELPSPLAFNHAIVTAQVAGNTVWMDPTCTNQRGPLRQRFLPPYEKVLVVSDSTTGLCSQAISTWDDSGIVINECFILRDRNEPATLTVRSVCKGREAERYRAQLASRSRSDWERGQLNYYAQRYAEVELNRAVDVADSTNNNTVCTTARYLIRNMWRPSPVQTNRLAVTFAAQELEPYVRQPATVLRRTPLGLPYPSHVSQLIEVALPGDWRIKPEKVVFEDTYLFFSFTSTYTNRLLTLNYQLRTLADSVPLADMAKHLRLRRQIAQSLEYSVLKGMEGSASFTFNSPLVSLWAAWCAMLMALWTIAYRYHPAPPPLPTIGDETPSGIGGWLILPCIGLAVGLCSALARLVKLHFCLNATIWHNLTMPESPAYHALWRPVLILELLGITFLVALITLNIILLLRHRSSFPRFMILLIATNLLLEAGDSFLGQQIPAVAAAIKQQQVVVAQSQALLGAFIWIPYFLVSRRVRNTFRKP